MEKEEKLYAITVKDVQNEAIEKIGRELTEEELHAVKKGLDFGIGTSLGNIYQTIFTEMI